MQKLEDKIAADSSSIKTKDEELDKVKNEKKELEDKVKNLEEKVKDLEKEPGGETHTAVDDNKAQDFCSDQVSDVLIDFA